MTIPPRTRRLRALALLLLSAIALGCSAAHDSAGRDRPTRPEGAPPTLILISIDGYRGDYFDLHPSPTLQRLAREGVRAKGLEPVFPTKTFPNHYTIVTGLYPEHHGIVTNTIYSAERDAWFRLSDREAVADGVWWGGEPVWVTAQRAGLRTATLFWPGSEAEIAGARPTEWRPYDESMSAEERVDLALEWLSRPPTERPSFVTLYFEAVDDAGHRHGPTAPETDAAVRAVDRALERLVDGLESRGLFDRVDLLLVSDHGMAELSADRVIVLEDLVDLADVTVVAASTFAMLRPRPGREAPVLERLRGAHPHLSVFARREVPERLHYRDHPDITPIVAIADEGWYVFTTRRQARRGPSAGMHGYDPAAPSMQGLFLARGPSFARGRLVERVRAVDLYELMTRLLGVEPAPNDGELDRVLAVLAAGAAP